MKAIILAAGKGTRMQPLTEDTPKPLLPVAGKPIIQHNIDQLQDLVSEIIIVAGYRIEEFEQHFSGSEIKIIEQEEPLGTADAALKAEDHIEESALILNGDDIYGEKLKILAESEDTVLASKVSKPENYGVYDLTNGEINGLEEKPDQPKSNYVNTGCFSVRKEFFKYLKDIEKSSRGEYEITDGLKQYLEDNEITYEEAEKWLPCSYPWQLINANEELAKFEREIKTEIPESVTVKGDVKIEENVNIRENTVIEGPAYIKSGCEIKPNSYIRENTILEENVEIGNSEIKNSVIRKNSKIPHFSYIGDSYIGKNVNIGAGTKTANLRGDHENIKMIVKGEIIDTGRKKLGAIIGSKAKLGVNNSIKPGRKIGYKSVTDSGEKIDKNIPSRKLFKDGNLS